MPVIKKFTHDLPRRRLCSLNNNLYHLSLIDQRDKGKIFDFSEHLKGIIYSFLTNQRPWYLIVPNLNDIDKLFFNYNYELILKNDADYFIEGILTLTELSKIRNLQF